MSLMGSSFWKSLAFCPGSTACSGGGCSSGGFHWVLYQSVQLGMVKSVWSFKQAQLGSALGQYPVHAAQGASGAGAGGRRVGGSRPWAEWRLWSKIVGAVRYIM